MWFVLCSDRLSVLLILRVTDFFLLAVHIIGSFDISESYVSSPPEMASN